MFEDFANSKDNQFQKNMRNLDQSTPTGSLSDLIIGLIPTKIDKKSDHHNQIFVSSMFNDITKLKKEIKIYNPYDMNQYEWFEKIKAICTNNYQNPNDIISFFHLFVDKIYRHWALNLKITTLEDLEKDFYTIVFKSKKELQDDLHLDQAKFLERLKVLHKNDKEILQELKDYPLSSFFKYKALLIRRLYKSLSDKDLIRLIIFMFDEKDIVLKLEKFIDIYVVPVT